MLTVVLRKQPGVDLVRIPTILPWANNSLVGVTVLCLGLQRVLDTTTRWQLTSSHLSWRSMEHNGLLCLQAVPKPHT